MGPAKGSRTIPRITIKKHEDRQYHEDPTSSSKMKLKKRKMSDLGPQWSKDELMLFYEAYRRHGKNWKKVSAVIGSKSTDMVEALYSAHRTFLSLPERDGTAMGFIALVTGHHNVLESPSHKETDQIVRSSGKRRRRGEAAQHKENAALHPHDAFTYEEMSVAGFTSSFKELYYGELVRCIRRHPVEKRTPRVPVIAPSDINATYNSTPQIKNIVSSSKNTKEDINDDGTVIAMDECSPDGSSGITEANKVAEGQTFLEIRRTGDTEISQTQQHLKKRRIQESTDEAQTSKVELGTTMVAEERNNLDDYQRLSQLFSPDEMMVLDVLESLVTVPSKMPQPEINIPSGALGKRTSASSHRQEEVLPPVDQSKQRKQASESSASTAKKKRRNKLLDGEVLAEEQQSNSGNSSVIPEARQVDTTERPSLNPDFEKGATDLPESTANISAEVSSDAPMEIDSQINMSRKSKRKSKIPCRTKHVFCNEGADNLQATKLLHCLSSESLRRWCTYEWFYSAVDYPWFMNNEFVNYLNFAKLSHLSRLTRSEWSTIRSSLGKPRRFSDHFLAVEKEKLEDYRENVRKYYSELSDGLRDSLPADLARPFSVGQNVIVRHPSSRELCDGKVLLMERDCYKVQFDRPDLGVDIVKDTDCMPINWLDNLPDHLKKRNSLSNNAHRKVDIEHIPELTTKESCGHIINGVSRSEPSSSPHVTSEVESAVDCEMLPNKSTSGRYTASPLQFADASSQPRGRANNMSARDTELDSFVTAFVQNSLSQAKQMVGEAMQAESREEGRCTSNQASHCLESEAALGDGQLPSSLILNCVATVLAIKDLSEYRHPPAKIAGVLEHAFSMLRPSCPENLAIYSEIESCISVVKNQILALVPTASGNGSSAMLM
ncbi:protein ALWAYS EARLY 3-like [Lolium rigidum]|uniref:protein ALWAYS EARLY 3-like n=1 Tax=Lolium rigidum TaxID=89674 RepID=UPI001F5C893A|nr:protein ALWAYS EARLY 3-like [Lolium rigidum]